MKNEKKKKKECIVFDNSSQKIGSDKCIKRGEKKKKKK